MDQYIEDFFESLNVKIATMVRVDDSERLDIGVVYQSNLSEKASAVMLRITKTDKGLNVYNCQHLTDDGCKLCRLQDRLGLYKRVQMYDCLFLNQHADRFFRRLKMNIRFG